MAIYEIRRDQWTALSRQMNRRGVGKALRTLITTPEGYVVIALTTEDLGTRWPATRRLAREAVMPAVLDVLMATDFTRIDPSGSEEDRYSRSAADGGVMLPYASEEEHRWVWARLPCAFTAEEWPEGRKAPNADPSRVLSAYVRVLNELRADRCGFDPLRLEGRPESG